MNLFANEEEKINFLKKYKLMPKSFKIIPTYYYYYTSSSNVPETCNVIGYESVYETWANVTIEVNGKQKNVHSDYLLEMKKKGEKYIKTHKSAISSVKKNDNGYIICDIETTGFNRKNDEIIEISAIKVSSVGITEFSELVRPDSIIPLNIVSLTGISNELVYNAKTIDEVLPRFLNFIGSCKLVGHNIISFDIPFINTACERLNLPLLHNELEDTLLLARKKIPTLENHKLSTICSYYDIDYTDAHRGLSDCYLCYECYKNLTMPLDSTAIVESNINNINNPFEREVLNTLQEIIHSEELPEQSLYLYSNIPQYGKNKGQETSKSICVHEPAYPSGSYNVDRIGKNDIFLNISRTDKNEIKLHLNTRYLSSLSLPENVTVIKNKSSRNFTDIIFPSESNSVHEFIKSVVLVGLSKYESSSSFGCCSQFIKCSDEKKCVHENKLYSKGCKYRTNLEAGRIFYGKNRNID